MRKRTKCSKTLSGSSEKVISFNKEFNQVNSNYRSTSTTAVLCNVTPANFGIICGRKLQIRNKTDTRSENKSEIMGPES